MAVSRRGFLGGAGAMAAALPMAAATTVPAAPERDFRRSIPNRVIPAVAIGPGLTILNNLPQDETTDCAPAIQAAVTKLSAQGGGTVLIPWQHTAEPNQSSDTKECVYIINPKSQAVGGVYCGVQLQPKVRIQFAPGVKIKAATISGAKRAYMFYGAGVSDAEIANGWFVGERYTHVYSSPSSSDEWCHGIQLLGVRNVNIRATLVSDCTGDGICIGSRNGVPSSNVTLCDVHCTGNRRQGLSLTGCDGVGIYDSEFSYTHGTAPSDGIDIEPEGSDSVSNVTIHNCVLRGNAADGIQMNANRTQIKNVNIVACLFASNYYAGIAAQTSNAGAIVAGSIYGNAFFQNGFYGLYVKGATSGYTIGGPQSNSPYNNSFANNRASYPTDKDNFTYPNLTQTDSHGYVAGSDMNLPATSANSVQWNSYFTH